MVLRGIGTFALAIAICFSMASNSHAEIVSQSGYLTFSSSSAKGWGVYGGWNFGGDPYYNQIVTYTPEAGYVTSYEISPIAWDGSDWVSEFYIQLQPRILNGNILYSAHVDFSYVVQAPADAQFTGAQIRTIVSGSVAESAKSVIRISGADTFSNEGGASDNSSSRVLVYDSTASKSSNTLDVTQPITHDAIGNSITSVNQTVYDRNGTPIGENRIWALDNAYAPLTKIAGGGSFDLSAVVEGLPEMGFSPTFGVSVGIVTAVARVVPPIPDPVVSPVPEADGYMMMLVGCALMPLLRNGRCKTVRHLPAP